jgi:hypothetical protein
LTWLGALPRIGYFKACKAAFVPFIRSLRSWFFLLAFLAAGWLAAGNALQVLAAKVAGQGIDITICTSGGGKKVVRVAADSGEPPKVMKHCGNAALAAIISLPAEPIQLTFAAPRTVAAWQYLDLPGTQRERTWESAPPLGRAPPALRA